MKSDRHLRFQLLAAATLLVALVPWPLAGAISDPVQLAGAYFGWALAMELFGAGGTLVAATTFARGEPQRPGWFLLSLSYLVFVPLMFAVGPRPALLYEGALRAPWAVLASNVAASTLAVVGLVVLARAWRSAGLDTSSRASRLVSRLVALGIGALLAGPDLVERLPAALGGDFVALGDVITDLLDVALFFVAVPVLRAALALGGGVLSWPWALLTASVGGWLGYDAVAVYGEAAGLEPLTIRVAEEVLRTVGAACAFSAGIAQRWAMIERPQG